MMSDLLFEGVFMEQSIPSRDKATIYFDNLLHVWNSAGMRNEKSTGKRFTVVIPETLHYRLRQTALKDRTKLKELVERLLWAALKTQ